MENEDSRLTGKNMRMRWLVTILFVGTVLPSVLLAQWPREIEVERGTIVIYQPQIESFEGNDMQARAAVSVQTGEMAGPVFGTVWLAARVETDMDERTVEVVDITVRRIRFPNSNEAQEDSLATLIEAEFPVADLSISLDRVLAELTELEDRRASVTNLNNTPPVIEFRDAPTILVTIDGDPILERIENSDHRQVVNTPFTIIRSSGDERYFLYTGDDSWYRADSLGGEWMLLSSAPQSIAALAPPPEDPPDEPDDEAEEGPPPAIMVATVPTELIVIDGPPEWAPIDQTDLLYVTNSESDIVLEIEGQTYYIILSGRWYASASLDGPWSFVEPEALPAMFANIPGESDMSHLLASVPGTPEAEEAVVEQWIPQTAGIDRDSAALDVEYDGDPEFEPIEETTLAYAVNSPTAVIRFGSTYYAVDEAVWFFSGSPTGPWVVADSIPEEIYDIPADSPVHNVTYVYVFDATPEVVYVGYYPGYVGSYHYHGVIVYGTGWYYHPWYRTYYYPRPVTYGFHMRWNPWYGWSFGFSYSTGPFTFHIGYRPGYRGYWGPVGYRGYRRGYHRGWHAGYRAGAGAGYRAGYRAGQRTARNNNIYNRSNNRARNAPSTRDRAATRPSTGQTLPSTRPSTRPNNVYSDRSGNISRNQNGNWQSRGSNGWQSGGAQNRQQLDRSQQSRQRGNTRSQNYNRSRGGGAARGGRRGPIDL